MPRSDNFLDRIYKVTDGLVWSVSDDGVVVVDMENTGFTNRVAQRFFKQPKVSHITLEGMGSFIFRQIDGVRSVYDIGAVLKEEYKDEAEPLYERLSVYMKQLETNGFITLVA